jgi:hypothetical protein
LLLEVEGFSLWVVRRATACERCHARNATRR